MNNEIISIKCRAAEYRLRMVLGIGHSLLKRRPGQPKIAQFKRRLKI